MFDRRGTTKEGRFMPVGQLCAVKSAEYLLRFEKRKNLIREITENSRFTTQQFNTLFTPLINQVALYCQQLPDSESYYFSDRGGLLDYILGRTHAALELLQTVLIVNDDEQCSNEQLVWIYAIFSASMLQGLGKLYSEYKVDLFDSYGKLIKRWNPLADDVLVPELFYLDSFNFVYDDSFRRRLNFLFAKLLMPVEGLAWLTQHPEVFAQWLALLDEDDEGGGMLGAILSRAKTVTKQHY